MSGKENGNSKESSVQWAKRKLQTTASSCTRACKEDQTDAEREMGAVGGADPWVPRTEDCACRSDSPQPDSGIHSSADDGINRIADDGIHPDPDDVSEDLKSDKSVTKRRSRTLPFRRRKSDKMKESKKDSGTWTFRLRKHLPGRLRRGRDHGLPDPAAAADTSSCVCTKYNRRPEEDDANSGAAARVYPGRPSFSRSLVMSPLISRASSRNSRRSMGAGPGFGFTTEDLLLEVPVPPQPILPPDLVDIFDPDEYPTEDIDELRIAQRARDMEMGVELVLNHHIAYPHLHYGGSVSGGSSPSGSTVNVLSTSDTQIRSLSTAFQNQCLMTSHRYVPMEPEMMVTNELHYSEYNIVTPQGTYIPRTVHTQIDYIHCLVPDLLHIAKCSFYWGVMDRYEAEKLLENRAEGTFLLRDSAQEEFLFSVSFRRYSRSLHARIEQWNHRFSFDSHDPGVYSDTSVCGLLEHYKDPSCCLFFEPMLTLPLNRTFAFSLQHLCRAVVCRYTTYDSVNLLPLPKSMKDYLKYYHYKQKVRVRRFEFQQ